MKPTFSWHDFHDSHRKPDETNCSSSAKHRIMTTRTDIMTREQLSQSNYDVIIKLIRTHANIYHCVMFIVGRNSKLTTWPCLWNKSKYTFPLNILWYSHIGICTIEVITRLFNSFRNLEREKNYENIETYNRRFSSLCNI